MEPAKITCYEEPATLAIDKKQLAKNVFSGIIAAEASALIMGATMMAVFTIFLERHPLFPFQVIASFALGSAAVETQTAGAVFLGLAIHLLGPTIFWGATFGVLVYFLNVCRGSTLVILGLGIGIMAQIVDVNAMVPGMYTLLHGRDIWTENVPLVWSWAAHLIFGVVLGAYPVAYDYVMSRYPEST